MITDNMRKVYAIGMCAFVFYDSYGSIKAAVEVKKMG